MKKSDLKNGMIIETRNGNKYIVIKDFGIYEDTYEGIFWPYSNVHSLETPTSFEDYNDDLLVTDSMTEYDIMKIYYSEFVSSNNLVLLWERKEIKLTDNERKLLEILYDEGLKWMCRGYNTSILFFKEEPTEEDSHWDTQFEYFGTVSNMFAFMTEEDDIIYNIETLLKGEWLNEI